MFLNFTYKAPLINSQITRPIILPTALRGIQSTQYWSHFQLQA